MRFDPKYLPYKPNNVMAEEWIPQQEILGNYGYCIDKYWNFLYLLILIVTERTSDDSFYNVYQRIKIQCSLYHIVV